MATQVGEAVAVLKLDKSNFDSGMSQAEGKFSGLGSKAAGVGTAMAGALATAGVAAVAGAATISTAGLSAFKNLESAASSAASKAVDVNGKSADQIKAQYSAIQDHVIKISNDLAATTVFDPSQVANAFDILAAKGSDISKIGRDELLPFLDLAAGTQTDLASATDLVTGAINSFGLSMSDSGSVADQLAMAMNGSSAASDTLNYALRQGGATAAATGMSLAEFSSIVGVLSDKNYTGEQSGAALKTALLALYTPTEKQTNALAKLGLSYDQVDPRTHKFTDTLKLLLSKGADIGDFGNIFTDSSGAIMYALAGAGDSVDSLTAKIAGSSGLAHTQASLIMDTNKLVGAWETAKGATEGMTTAIGSALEPAAVKLLNTWTALVPKIQEFAVALASGDWEKAGQMIKDSFSEAWEYIKNIDWGSVAEMGVEAIKSAWQGLQSLGSDLIGWLQGVDWGGVATTITEAIRTGWEDLKDLGSDLADWVRDYDWATLASDVADLIKAGWKAVRDWATDIISGIKTDFTDWVNEGGPAQIGKDLGKAVAEGAKDLGKWIYENISSWFKANGSSLSGIISSSIDFVKVAAKAAWDFATSFGSTILAAGKGTIGAAILEIIGGAMDSVWDGAGDTLRTKAAEWRAAAEDLFASEDFETDINFNGLGDVPSKYDGKTIDVNVNYKLGGGTIEPGNFSLNAQGDVFVPHAREVTYMDPKEWVLAMHEIGNDFDTIESQVSKFTDAWGAKLSPEKVEEIMAVLPKAANEAADTTTTTTKKASEGFLSTTKKANALTMGIFETSANTLRAASAAGGDALKQASAAVSAAGAAMVDRILIGSQTAANAIQQGAQVAANFATQAGQAVKIGLDASGREIAVIGQVAQQRFTQAGGELYNKVQVAGSGFQNSVQSGANAIQSGANAVNGAANNLAGAASNAASSLANAYASFARNNPYSGNASPSYPISQTISFSSSASSSRPSSSSSSSDPSWWNAAYVAAGGRAMGTETTGPELAVIGEAGREWVIPEKHKRWDLLLAAMRAYGITGMAEGGAAGASGSGDAVDADEMKAYFGIKGLASMNKQVQKIITDLKNFFRISWGIIKAEGSVYWRQINEILTYEVTTFRDNAWQAAIGIRNTWIQTNAQILDDTKTNYAAIWPAIEPTVTNLNDSIKNAFYDAKNGVTDAINQMVANGESSLLAFSENWGQVWSDMLTDLSNAQSQISSAVSQIAAELQRINVSVNISSSGGGYGGGGGGGGGGMDWAFASESDWLAPTGDWSEYGGGNSGCSGSGCYIAGGASCRDIYNNAVIASTGPLATAGLGVELGGGGYGGGGYGGTFGTSSWGGLAPIFRARGGLVNKPELDVIADQGPEIILPNRLTRMFTALADAGFESIHGGSGGGRVVIEDHTVHKWYLDGKEVTNQIMARAVKEQRLRGAVPVR